MATTDSLDTIRTLDIGSLGLNSLGIVGAGQMGTGIAQVSAHAGIDVTIVDVTQAQAEAGRSKIAKSLDRLIAKDKIDDTTRQSILDRIGVADTVAALANCDIVIEAAPENEATKIKILQSVAENLSAQAILASNTSSISITTLAKATPRPSQVIGMHFMNPVPVMKLVEIVRGLQTSDNTYQRTVKLAQLLGKTTITSRDTPGFIVNRILIPFINEACFALYEGIGTAEDIDAGATLGLNHPMGPLALADLIGLDTCLSIAEVLHQQLGEDKYRPCPLLRQYVAAGWLGRKSGRGFYSYS